MASYLFEFQVNDMIEKEKKRHVATLLKLSANKERTDDKIQMSE